MGLYGPILRNAGSDRQRRQGDLEQSFSPSLSGIYQQSQAITGYDAVARLGGIHCPTLVAVGDEDILGGLPFSQRLADGIRDAQLLILKKAGHGLPTESPEATAAAMSDFLSSLDQPRSH